MIGSVVVMEKTLNKDKKHINETQEHVMDEIVVKAEKIVASKVYYLNKELENPEIHNKELAFAIKTNGRVKGAFDVLLARLKEMLSEAKQSGMEAGYDQALIDRAEASQE